MLYFPNTNRNMTEEQVQRLIDLIIRRHELDKPFIVQYSHWLGRMLQGEWGYSPKVHMNVLDALVQRTPASAELLIYSLAVFIPLGIVSGVRAGGRKGQRPDNRFRTAAFIATSLPPFVLSLVLLSIFWVGVYWFPIGRVSTGNSILVGSSAFKTYTGLLTIDGLLNGRSDVSLDALRHLVLPVLTLSLAHWATLGRITRAATVEELGKEYILAARGHGVSEKNVLWKHALRNVLVPALSSSALSAATLVTSLFVVEVVFLFNGVSSMFTASMSDTPDVTAALGFAIYSILAVLSIMTVLDILQAAVDPRIRAGGKLL
jgi:peptide/nickel transport system permease protein